MTKLLHRTCLERAVRIMDEGFYPRRESVDIERGANFHLAGHVNEENPDMFWMRFDFSSGRSCIDDIR